MRALLPENGVPWAEEQPKFLKTGAVWHSSVCWFLQCKKYAVSDTANRWRVKQKRFFMRYIMKLESICNGILHIIRVHEGSAGVWTKSWQITAEKYCTQWAGKSWAPQWSHHRKALYPSLDTQVLCSAERWCELHSPFGQIQCCLCHLTYVSEHAAPAAPIADYRGIRAGDLDWLCKQYVLQCDCILLECCYSYLNRTSAYFKLSN